MSTLIGHERGGRAPTPAPAANQPKNTQLKSKARALDFASGAALLAPDGEGAAVQAHGGALKSPDVQAVAAAGTAAASDRLPHAGRIQAAFGHHDVSAVQAQVGGAAGPACDTLGASAYASGDRVAFQAAPDLHTAAHEAAHVVQQRAGVQLAGGVGQRGDRYEQHADAVADAVVAGRSAEGLLDAEGGGGGAPARPLQRLANATAGVQLYSKGSKDYSEQKDDTSTIPMFTNELADPQIKGQNAEAKIGYDRQDVDHPAMRFADDDTLGIQATKRVDPMKGGGPELTHAKELYVSPGSLAGANQSLTGVGSMVRLAPTGHQITRRGKALLGVKPGLSGEQSAQIAEEMVSLRTDVCIDLAQSIIAGAPQRGTHAVLGNGQDRSLTKVSNTESESAQVSQLGQHLGGGGSSDTARESMVGGAPVTPGQEYGTRLGRGELDQQAQELGINEHAKPKVGEGYATYTMGGSGQHAKTDYSVLTNEQPTEREHIWGYHYAGVVATSEDGRDTATLENYNRKGDILDAKKQLLAKLKQDFAGILDEIQLLSHDDKVGPTDARLKAAYAKIAEAGRSNGLDAQEMFRRATTVDNASAWFFAMYGSNPKQSFHEKNAKSGYFANPLTVRVTNELQQILAPFKLAFGMRAPVLPQSISNDPAFQNIATARGAVAAAADNAASVGEVRQLVAQAMDDLRTFLINAIWSALGNQLLHTGVHLPNAVPADFVGLRSALGDIAGELNDKSRGVFTRRDSNQRRQAANVVCHETADYVIKAEQWLTGCLAML